ncbi:hypothetical protein NP493_261g02022 [Ridgeia piscesae]|uniref:Uncharacterized protein n=1 Tax=Ridgeia piscesae TaxID=27915 RepID=A0AAD9NY36_RIDPI|nr:hypothetical protein NP493_261g02022 [Ridgeia piscesae]
MKAGLNWHSRFVTVKAQSTLTALEVENRLNQDLQRANMVVAVRSTHQSSYCSCCNQHFNSLQTPRDAARTKVSVLSCTKDNVVDAGHEDWNANGQLDVRPDVKLASRVHFVLCHNCNAHHRNPPYDNMYTEEKTDNVLVYGALLRLMGDMFQHRYSPDHR